MFRCKLQIEGVNRKLSLEDGINLKDLAELLSKLSKCLGKKSNAFTLTFIENSSYSPIIETDVSECVDEFYKIHEDISKVELERLPKDYQDYASSLNKILFENGLYIKIQSSKDDRNIRLTGLTKLSSKQYYFSITTLSGVLNSLYGKNESKPSIAIRCLSGKEYTIQVTPEQEKEISHFYKGLNLRLRVRVKKDVLNGNILQSSLIDYIIPSETSFMASVQNIQLQYGDIFKNIVDSAKHLNQIRNSKNG